MKKSLFIFLLLPLSMLSQHYVKGVFSPASEFSYAFLYHATPNGSNYVDRSPIDSDGRFKIKLDETAPAGIYKIVYGLPPENNNFDLIYNGKEDIAVDFSLDGGLTFTVSNENQLWSSYNKSMELINSTISKYYSEQSSDKNAFKDIFKTLKETQEGYEKASKNTMAHTFIIANKPYIPESYEDLKTYSKNLKKNYIKSIDFSNELLQSSDFLSNRAITYVFGMNEDGDKSIYKHDIDNLVSLMRSSNTSLEAQTSILQDIWMQFTQQQNDEMANYISNEYLLELSKKTKRDWLTDGLLSYQRTSLGTKAPDFDIAITENGKTITTSLHKLNSAEQYLIVFWSSTCGHCLNELPKLKSVVPDNIKIIAIGLEEDTENWKKEIVNYPNFTHILGLEKWENPIAKDYNVVATPTFFLLNKNKIIIAKPYDVDALRNILEK